MLLFRELFAAWVARSVVAALLLALLELALLVPVFPAAASTGTGLLFVYVAVARTYLMVTLFFGLTFGLLFGGAKYRWRLRFPEPVSVLSALIALVLGSVMLHSIQLKILAKDIDFPETRAALLLLSGFLSIGFSIAANHLLLAPLMRKLIVHMPQAGRADRIAAFALCLIAIGALAAAHATLAPVHQVTLCAFAGLGAACCAVAATSIAWKTPSRWASLAISGLGLLLILSTTFDTSPTGRFVLYGPASTAGPIAARLRKLLDRDGDGASPLWAGGTDCFEGNSNIGPHVTDLPADGVDQDCTGRDSPASVATEPLPTRSPISGCESPSVPRSVLLITIDALRADAPSVQITPNLAKLAASALVFDRAYAPSTMTGPSLAGLFSGHAMSTLNPHNAASDEPLLVSTSLAQRFQNAGYRTAAFNRVALKTTSFAGFDEYNPQFADVQPRGKGQLLAASMVNGALTYMLRPDSRAFFIWIHFLDTHAPYPFDDLHGLLPSQIPLSPYERGVQYVDSHIGRLLRELSRAKLLENMVIAITADHGEELGTRARLGHGPYVFDDVARVPLLLLAAGCKPSTIDQPVSLTHLGTALGDLAGVAIPGRTLIAASQQLSLPVVTEEAPVSALGFKRAVMLGHHKLIVDAMNGGRMLFNLETDPDEVNDIYTTDPTLARAMESAYQAWLDHPADR